MATYAITIHTDLTAIVNKNGTPFYKPRNMVPTVTNEGTILFQHPTDVSYNFYIDPETDTVTAEGNPITGTADEMADALVEAVFFVESGASVDGITSTPGALMFGDWSGEAPFLVDIATTSTSVGLYADTDFATVGLYGQNASAEIKAYRNSTGNAANDQKVAFETQNALAAEYRTTNAAPHVFKIAGTEVFKIAGVVQEYADNAAAAGAGLSVGSIYRTGDALKIVHA